MAQTSTIALAVIVVAVIAVAGFLGTAIYRARYGPAREEGYQVLAERSAGSAQATADELKGVRLLCHPGEFTSGPERRTSSGSSPWGTGGRTAAGRVRCATRSVRNGFGVGPGAEPDPRRRRDGTAGRRREQSG